MEPYQAFTYAISYSNPSFQCLPWMGLERLVVEQIRGAKLRRESYKKLREGDCPCRHQ